MSTKQPLVIPFANAQTMWGSNVVPLQSLMQPVPRLTTETEVPLEPNRTFVQPHRPVSSSSRNQSFGSDIARTVYVPPGSPVMSIHWCGRLHRYVSAHPTEIPVRDVRAVRPPHHDSR